MLHRWGIVEKRQCSASIIRKGVISPAWSMAGSNSRAATSAILRRRWVCMSDFDEKRAKREAWLAAHPDYYKNWYEVNRERESVRKKKWQEDNPDYHRNYRQENGERIRARDRNHYREHREVHAARQREYEKSHRDLINARSRRNYQDRAKYVGGMTRKEKREWAESVEYQCEICGKKIEQLKDIHIDHSHVNGHTRGLLCRDCNLTLGHIHDNPALLRKAIRYLHKYDGYGELEVV